MMTPHHHLFQPAPVNLREAHAHIAQHGRAMSMVSLDACTSLDDFRQRIATATDRLSTSAGSGAWLLGHGLRVEGWTDPHWPTSRDLDAVTRDLPACIWSFDHHALVLNTRAMRQLGVTQDTPDPDNGRIERDPATGVPNGIMLEMAAKFAWQRIPEPTPKERREQVRAALADLASHGFAEVHDLVSQPWLGPLLAELDDAGQLPVKVLLYPLLPDLDQVLDSSRAWQRDRIRLAGAKLFADGTLNSRTAWMLHPYADPLPGLPMGQPMLSAGDLREAMRRLWAHSLGLAVHAIGDGAVRAVLDAADEAGISTSPSSSDLPRLRIEHAEIIDQTDIPRFASRGIIASMQPCHLLTDIEVLKRSLPHRLDRVLPLRELIDSGCAPGELLWFGSDTPIVRPHPTDSIQAAVHRRRADTTADRSLAPQQAITEREAWAAFQSGSARGAPLAPVPGTEAELVRRPG